jgi:hypothetical protein
VAWESWSILIGNSYYWFRAHGLYDAPFVGSLVNPDSVAFKGGVRMGLCDAADTNAGTALLRLTAVNTSRVVQCSTGVTWILRVRFCFGPNAADLTDLRLWCGLADNASVGNTDDPTGLEGIFFRFLGSNVGPELRVIDYADGIPYYNGLDEYGGPFAANTPYEVALRWDGSALHIGYAEVSNGVAGTYTWNEASLSSGIPTDVAMAPTISVFQMAGGAARRFYFGGWSFESPDPT